MTSQRDPYSRFYWRFRDEFPDIYANKEAFGWWMTLLAIAEGAHPTAPELPRRIKSSALTTLKDAGLLVLLPGDRYQLRGVSAEIERRSSQGKAGATARWKRTHSDRSPNGLLPQSLDETRQDETRRDAQSSAPTSFTLPVKGLDGAVVDVTVGGPEQPSADVARLQKLAETLTSIPYVMQAVHSGLGAKAINEQLIPHGYDRVSKVWGQLDRQVRAASGPGSRPTLRQLVLGADDVLNAVPRANLKEQQTEAERAAYDRRVARTRAELEKVRS